MECLKNNFQNGVVLNDRFQTIAPLNHGSFGMVFSARDLQTGEIVAIKCMTKRTAVADPNFDLFYDEKSEEIYCHRRLAAHPNIVNMIDTFETDAHLFIALEFCSQGDLYEAIRRGMGPLETEHVRDFMLELVDAVSYMHEHGIFHRDIKPENIFLSENGSMKLGDFGLATTDKWSYESAVGSDRYMSPEQYDSAGAGYSPAQADIWAIGVCLLNILFSRNPFTTPTESDPLFLDFSRDKQSLFDVFPSMSQDTYEVIVQFMNLNPTKRSLIGAREALLRVVSFTTDDEALDDFCTAERAAIATANREPLRTPSLQSPLLDQGAFPWTMALHTGAKSIRQLSAIPDDESYTEELFPKSENTSDWFSGSALTPSISSVLTSNLAASMKSLAISRPLNVPTRAAAPRVSAMAGSLPITMSKPRPTLNAMSLVFGREKEVVSKSWSDMWEEDLEEDEEEYARQLQALKELNSRTWSQESKMNDIDTLLGSTAQTPVPASDAGSSPRSPAIDTFPADIDIDDDIVADGFFFEEHVGEEAKYSLSRYSPPAKRSGMDKWAELGERRRALPRTFEPKSAEPALNTQRHFGYEFKSSIGIGNGLWDTTNQQNQKGSRDRAKSRGDCPWNHGRDWNWREKRPGSSDIEWVGHWQESH
ncbi:protein-serine/threonine kinase [Microdochium nivale]|nr:protein-serine/threonine kinase [Microdochium nivale]